MQSADYDYSYDSLSRLVNVTKDSVSEEDFAYDANGNRTEYNTDTSWLYNARDELESYSGATFTYDAGNLASKTDTGGTTTYEYNAEGRLSRVEFADTTEATYLYDHAGRRVRKYVESTAETKRFLWSGDNLIAELDDTGIIERRYLWTGFEPVALIDTSGTPATTDDTVYYYHSDQIGTPQVLTDSSGTVVWSVEMDAFGNATETGSVTQPWRFPGQYYDAETGLYYNNQRYYDPDSGRYFTIDPARSGHLYAYAGGNPINVIDPLGLTDIDIDINRTDTNNQRTLGTVQVTNDSNNNALNLFSLELPDLGNRQNVSRINPGNYNATRDETRLRAGGPLIDVIRLQNVPGRDRILIHVGNTVDDTEGCILIGTGQTQNSVTNSRNAIRQLMDYVDRIIAQDRAAGVQTTITVNVQ